jgi:hypothetical protein
MLTKAQILNEIVSYLPDDKDFINLRRCNKLLNSALISNKSAIWKQRFLSIYDYPAIDKQTKFKLAYKIRRHFHTGSASFPNALPLQRKLQLEILRDMIIEAYSHQNAWEPVPSKSKNLAVIASPRNAPYMQDILNCFFYPDSGNPKYRELYGQPHGLFDALQLVLSHLLLSPKSQYAHAVQSSRNNYDIAIVYNWGAPLELLYRLVKLEGRVHLKRDGTGRPNTSNSIRDQYKSRMELNLNALLHIRNFWHRHFIEAAAGGFGSNDIVEDTYARMANKMASFGLTPKKWDRKLQDGDLNVSGIWHGHYSTLAQWPKRKSDLEELQSLAEDWKQVDPLVTFLSATRC